MSAPVAFDGAAVAAWFRVHARDLPWRRPGTGAWEILLIEVMSQQTQIERAGAAWREWLERWPTPADLAAAPPGEAIRQWGRLGYPRRALRLHQAAARLVAEHGGRVPADVDALLALPGLGPYTAGAVAVFAYGIRAPVVDTNVRRVLARAVHGRPVAAAPSRRDEAEMLALLPEDQEAARVLSAAVMELGALVCTARAPECDACPIRHTCAWLAAGRPDAGAAGVRRAPRYEGSDRQLRGRVLAALRARRTPAARGDFEHVHADPDRVDRVLAGLVDDGLVVIVAGAYVLPGH